MEALCSPFNNVISKQSSSIISKCSFELYLTFIPNAFWIILPLLQFILKKKQSNWHPPSILVTNQLALIVSYFLMLTILLFFTDEQKVSGVQLFGLLSSILLWVSILGCYQFTCQKHTFGLSFLVSLKLFWCFYPLWTIFKFIVVWISFDEESQKKSDLLQFFGIIPQVLTIICFIILLKKKFESLRGDYQRVEGFSFDEIQVQKQDSPNTFERSSIFSRLFMLWVYPLLKIGRSKYLQQSDLQKPRKIQTSQYQKAKMKEYIVKHLQNTQSNHALLKAVYHRFALQILPLVAVGGLMTIMQFSSAVFIKFIQEFLTGDQPMWRGYALVSYMLLGKLIQAMASNHFRFSMGLLGAHIRAGLSSTIFDKSLKISSGLLSSTDNQGANFTYGQVVNLMQVDLQRLATGIPFSMRAVIWPFQISIGIYLLYATLGWQASSSGIALMLVLFAANGAMARYQGRVQREVMQKKDVRMKYCNELLTNMKVLKLYNWEKKIAEKVKQARQVEMSLTQKYFRVVMLVIFLNWGTRNYLVIAIITTMSLMGQTLTPANIFSGITVIGILNMSIRFVPDIISNFMNMVVALGRIQKYLQCKEIHDFMDAQEAENNPTVAVQATDASFSWESLKQNTDGELQEAKTILKDLSFSIQKGEFVAIVGRVGSGKSSIFQSLIKNMNLVRTSDQTSVFVNGSISYVSQQAWIQNATIKDNILFGNKFDPKKYQEVLQACQLLADIEILPGGDLTEIGERGINLSGGQKTRVSLARAVYADHDIFLLDDPLSAVDAHVGSEIFSQCLQGFLRKKTRLLITNNQQFLPMVDRIFVMNQGRLVQQGHYYDLIQGNSYFANEFVVTTSVPQLEKQQSSAVQEEKEEEVQAKQKKKPTNITQNQQRAFGQIGFRVYRTYFKYMGGSKVVILIVFFMLCWQADRMYTDLYLGQWTQESADQQKREMTKNLLIYSIASFSVNLFVLFRLIVVISGCIYAAKTIFRTMLKTLLNAPINKYFDVTPLGQIVNRLSKDQANLDTSLCFALNWNTGHIFQVIMMICICCYIVPYMLIIVPFALLLALKIRGYYISSSRELTRLESLSRSPIINQFSESISGTSVIRAFGYQSQFLQRNAGLLNKNMKIFFQLTGASAWLGITLELVSDMMLTFSAFLIVGTRGMIEPGMAGVCLTYAVTLPDTICWMIYALAFLQNQMVSAQRTHALCQILPQAPRKRPQDEELKQIQWPAQGKVEFKNFQMKYRDDTQLVLRGVTGVIQPTEKIGIVGRTGSGKSSLCMAMFRIVQGYSGSIEIDGVDIASLGLDFLRQKVCVIPQEPTLFEGTIKDNLDPFGKVSQRELESIVREIQLFSQEEPVQILEKPVTENGNNFSLGQRQLICIARAIIGDAKIMFLDEATASVDYKTDELIQKIIREKFSQRTVLTIAHRINTIMDYDRIIVMDRGVIAEFDRPDELMRKKGIFYQLVKKHEDLK